MNIRNLTITVTAAVAVAGCTTNEKSSSLIITGVVLATPGTTTTTTTTSDAGTVADAGTSASACPNPVFAATSTTEPVFPIFNPTAGSNLGGDIGFVVKNQLVDPTTLNSVFRLPTNTFTPHQAVVDYEIVGGGPAIPEQVLPVAGGPVAGSGTATIVVPLFTPTAILAALPAAAFVRTTTRIEGSLDDGSKVTTSAQDFVVNVCATCTGTPCF
jgi:hypothetical protein